MPSYKLYDALGLPPKADINDVKKTYKRLAIQHHPDKGGTEDEFRKITEAYETLGNPGKKTEYDEYGDNGAPPPNLFEGMGGGGFEFDGGFPFEFMFNRMGGMGGMGGRQRAQEVQLTPPIVHVIKLTMEESFTGKDFDLNIDVQTACNGCIKKCNTCNGAKHRNISRQIGPGIIQSFVGPCDACNASGFKHNKSSSCTSCDRLGMTKSDFSRKIKIPPGVQNGDSSVFNSLGNTMPGMARGNIVVQFEVEKKKTVNGVTLEIQDNNIHYYVNLPFIDSLLGTTLNVWHPSKTDIVLTTAIIDNIISPQKSYTIINKGMRAKNSSSHGDAVIHFAIQYNIDTRKIPLEVKQSLRETLSQYVQK